ncbi:MAG: HDOD domain-containing protein [Gammaproteobacteria bacterium]|nr:HDOD domain-containing protein [Gammaproteobacteria bacterium]
MSFSDLILTLLEKQKLAYEILRAPDAVSLRENWLEQTVPLSSVARLAILQDGNGLVLAFFPADRILNLNKLQSILHRDLRFVATAAIANHLKARLALSEFQLNNASGIQVIIDEHLTNQEIIYFEAPQACTLFRVKSLDLQHIASDILICSVFSDFPQNADNSENGTRRHNLKERIAKLDRLPAMPEMPRRILALRNDPNSTVDQLVELVEQDLSLSAQTLRYANSSIFATREKVVSLKDAIFRVLGYETVLHLALGYALGRVFKLPEKGPLGQLHFWQHATYAAALAQHLANAMPKQRRPKAGIAYLAGLLHDIGFLALNLFFKNEHAWLNKMIEANPDQSVVSMEKRLLGVSHDELGAWLMQAWKMPEELIICVEHHHDANYHGPYAEYVLLLNLTERLLKTHGMSDGDDEEIPPELLERLGLEEEQVFLMLDEVLSGGETLKEMAQAISA